VSELEQNQVEPTPRRGFVIGADRFWPLLGIALLINIPIVVVSLVLVLLAVIPLLVTLLPVLGTASRSNSDQWVGLLVTGGAASVLLFCCVILFLVLLQLIIRPFYEFFVRACVIGRRGALDAIQEGYRIVRANIGSSILLYILVIAIGFAYGLLMVPIALILLGIAVISGFAVGSAANSVLAGIVVAAVIGIPVLLVLLFVAGLYEVFESTLWTEGFLGLTRPPAAPALAETPAAG
jgi:hypothetical protein